MTGQGRFLYQRQHQTYPCTFAAKNTQFHALYFDRFKAGYEPEVCAAIDMLLHPQAVFVDIGANWGYFCGYVASYPGFQGKIIAFEPQLDVFQDLQTFVSDAQLNQCVQSYRIALSNQHQQGVLRRTDHWHSGLAALQIAANGPVSAVPLDAVVIPSPTILKLDVEGHEYPVLEGALKIIQKHKPAILFECLPHEIDNLKNIGNLLHANDYEGFVLKATPNASYGIQLECNALSFNSGIEIRHKTNILALPTCKIATLIKDNKMAAIGL